jgi:hypothetical protein
MANEFKIKNGIVIDNATPVPINNISSQVGTSADPAHTLLTETAIANYVTRGADFDYVDYNASLYGNANVPPVKEGRSYYNMDEHSIEFMDNNPYYKNISGQTTYARGKNQTGTLIPKGKCVYFQGVADDSLGIQIHLASADTYNKNWAYAITTEDIPTGQYGSCSFYGTHVNIDTSTLTVGQPVYMSTVPGELTSTRPLFPAQPIILGTCIVASASNGIFISYTKSDTYDSSADGCLVEPVTSTVTSNGTTITLTLQNQNTSRSIIPVQIRSKIYELPSPSSVTLTAGSSSIPQVNFSYIELIGSIPTLSNSVTSPTLISHVPISTITVTSAADVQTRGVLTHQRFKSETANLNGGRGRFSFMNERLFVLPPQWASGVTPTCTINTTATPDIVNLSVISGIVYQQTKMVFPALTVEDNGIYVVNAKSGAPGSLEPYQRLTNLLLANEDIAGNLLTNNRLHLVVFGLINESTNECKLCVNLPTAGYSTNDATAYDDYNNTAVYSVPQILGHTAFLIARIPLRNTGTGAEFINPLGKSEIINLLGNPIGISGGASGGGTTYIPNLIQVLGQGKSAGGSTINDIGTATLSTDVPQYGQTTPVSHIGSTGSSHGTSTTSVNGFMSSTDKTKLDGIATNANNYVLPAATASVIGGVKPGTGLTVAGDGTLNASGGAYTLPVATAAVLGGVKDGAGVTIAGDGTLSVDYGTTATTATVGTHVGSIGSSHGDATTSVSGFMSGTDKTKLDGIATNANNYSLPIATPTVLGGVKDGTGVTIAGDGTLSVDYGTTATTATVGTHVGSSGTSHAAVTTTVNGFMSFPDKSKLDGIATNANNYVLPAATASVIGGVKPGTGLTVAGDGTLNASAGTPKTSSIRSYSTNTALTSNLVINAVGDLWSAENIGHPFPNGYQIIGISGIIKTITCTSGGFVTIQLRSINMDGTSLSGSLGTSTGTLLTSYTISSASALTSRYYLGNYLALGTPVVVPNNKMVFAVINDQNVTSATGMIIHVILESI